MPTRPLTMKYPRATGTYSVPEPVRAIPFNTRQWKVLRERILIRDGYTCQKCGGMGNEVDHEDGDSSNNADSNLQTLCRPCHSRKTASENQGFGNRGRIAP